jgi:hypothetical protein
LIFRYCRDCSGDYNVVAVEPGSPLSLPYREWPRLLFGSAPVQLPNHSPAHQASFIDRLGAGDAAPSEHSLIAAARNPSDPKWSGSFFAANDPDRWVGPVEDLSEP